MDDLLTRTTRETPLTKWVDEALTNNQPVDCLSLPDDSKAIRKVARDINLTSGAKLTITDMQPSGPGIAHDRAYSTNHPLWLNLPRGVSAIVDRETGQLHRVVVGVRKFGDSEERFGPLSATAGGARRAADALVPLLRSRALLDQSYAAFMTKENGEMCKVSFVRLGASARLHCAVSSKNVTCVFVASSLSDATTDLACYTEARYSFAVEMARAFCAIYFGLADAQQRTITDWVCANGATLCGESISPDHQHIQSYRDTIPSIGTIRFFCATAFVSYERGGLTLMDPVEGVAWFQKVGLPTVEAVDVAPLSDAAALDALEAKHRAIPNREGAVVYIVVKRADGLSRTAIMYKHKNAWYVTVRALREKFSARASEAAIHQRVRALHLHHPDEATIVREWLGFYKWTTRALDGIGDFSDTLRSRWCDLKLAHEKWAAGEADWARHLPAALQAHATARLVGVSPAVVATGAANGSADAADGDAAAAASTTHRQPASSADISQTVVLVRGLQGSGKSTLCRALRHVLGGVWLNQDELSKAKSAKKAMLQGLESAITKGEQRYIFVDKIFTLKQHRDDVLHAVAKARGRCNVAIALLSFAVYDDDDGTAPSTMRLCLERIHARGLGHRTLVPQGAVDVDMVLQSTAAAAEPLTDAERGAFIVCATLDPRVAPEVNLASALHELHSAGALAPEHAQHAMDATATAAAAVGEAREHEEQLRGKWRAVYWRVATSWDDVLGMSDGGLSAHTELRALLAELTEASNARIPSGAAALRAIDDPHVTLLWLGEGTPKADIIAHERQIRMRSGQPLAFDITGVACDASIVALRVQLPSADSSLCANVHPHITVAVRPGAAAVDANSLLERHASGADGIDFRSLSSPLRVEGIISCVVGTDAKAGSGKWQNVGAQDVSDPASPMVAPTAAHANQPPATASPSPPRASCKFFEKGKCNKGDRCRFSHGATPLQSSAASAEPVRQLAATPTAPTAATVVAPMPPSGAQDTVVDELLRRTDLMRIAWPQAPAKDAELRTALTQMVVEERARLWAEADQVLNGFFRREPSQLAALVELDGATLEGGGQLLRSAFAYAVLLRRPVRVYNVRGGRSAPGMRRSHVAALGAITRISDATVTACELHTCVSMLVPPATPPVPSAEPFVVEVETGGATMLMLQAIMPVVVAQSAAHGGIMRQVTLRGGTNVGPPPVGGKGASPPPPFKLNAPQVDFTKLVLLPTLRRCFGIDASLEVVRRGFLSGGGEVRVQLAAPALPLRPLTLVEQGAPHCVRVSAFCTRDLAAKGVLQRMVDGAREALQTMLADVPVEWSLDEVDVTGKQTACGLVVALETTTGCALAGDSMGRMGCPAEAVGREAVMGMVDTWRSGACADDHLTDQLIIYMAMASGTSRLRVGADASDLHAQTGLWLAERFGAACRVEGSVIVVEGVGVV